MKEIPLSQGKVAFIDDEDFDRIGVYKWTYSGRYAVHGNGRNKRYMHRLILNAPPDLEVDHVNLDPLDNQRSNLRLVTHQEQQFNKPRMTTNTSGFKGVTWAGWAHKWRSQIEYNHRRISLGYYDNPIGAARAYDRGALLYFGKYAWLNFPETAPSGSIPGIAGRVDLDISSLSLEQLKTQYGG